ncbi:hypothetical protein PM082_024991 [Marasmius tenuissimus]|nr:hypothetical protein PM082_024991 [Marasmius tenuissimus]
MGYTNEDVDYIKFEAVVEKSKPLTTRSWNVLKTLLPEITWHYRGLKRLALLHDGNLPASTATIVVARCNLISERYFSFQRVFPPHEWRKFILPSVEAIWCLPPMRWLIGLPEDVEVTSEMVQNAITEDDYGIQIRHVTASITQFVVHYYGHLNGAKRHEVFSNWLLEPDAERPEFEPKDILGDPATAQVFCWDCKTVCTSAFDYVWHITGPCLSRREERRPWQPQAWSGTFFHSHSAAGVVSASLGNHTGGKHRVRWGLTHTV